MGGLSLGTTRRRGGRARGGRFLVWRLSHLRVTVRRSMVAAMSGGCPIEFAGTMSWEINRTC